VKFGFENGVVYALKTGNVIVVKYDSFKSRNRFLGFTQGT